MHSNGSNTTPSGLARPSMAGNSNALRHGLHATSKSALLLRTRKVRRLAKRVQEACPWIRPEQMPVVRSWCELEYIGAAMFTVLETAGVISTRMKDGDLAPRRLLSDYARIKGLQLQYSRELGITPASYAQVRVDALQGDDLASRAAAIRNGGTGPS